MDGECVPESAIFCLVSSIYPVEEVIFDHFTPSSERMVVTEAIPEKRMILTINAEPATEEYARLIGVAPDALGPRAFAENPLLMRQGGRHVVRAIQAAALGGARHDVLGGARDGDDDRAAGEPDGGWRRG